MAALPNTKVAGIEVEDVKRFFGITRWPEQILALDLGGRVVDVIPIPGHQDASVAIYDRKTGILLTGDTVYPGRISVRNMPEFVRSMHRLIDFTSDKPVAHILGTHIEQTTTPFVDYPRGTKYQPEEHPLALSRGVLFELIDAVASMKDPMARVDLSDISIVPRKPDAPAPAISGQAAVSPLKPK
jgi:glyoxylase-like metal-dependent hydrolase (beta-lactamase superfamily II)